MERKEKAEIAPRETEPLGLFGNLDRLLASAPVVDLVDKGTEFVLTAQIPGMTRENLEIDVGEDGAEIRAKAVSERKEEGPGFYMHETAQNSWSRRVPFPSKVLADRAETDLRDGVLTLRVPKAKPTPEKKSRKATVK